ncbi:MAG: hypothetical protein K2H32_07220 [Muribaculaceae bacterium]|nr:hypothetical protein [Muribaculaceae bacterium]MDE7155471.1 hypothetical protein [Muribaculaceae bacterium]MDE7369828.1 hypothetical protein [Muribaculaceae bacterium]
MRRLVEIVMLVVVAMVAALSSCNTTGCLDNRSSIPLADFYSSTTNVAVVTDSIEIGGVGAPGDSLLVGAGEKVSKIYLPLRSDQSVTAFYFEYKWRGMTPAYNDTLWIYYDSYPYFASEECGAMFRYRITRIEHTSVFLDSVAVMDSLVTNVEKSIMKLYFPTSV